MLASHTVQIHGITAWELKDRAGLRAIDGLTSDDVHARRVEMGHERVAKHGPPPRQPKGYTIKRTQAGNATQRAKAAAILSDPDVNRRRVKGISRTQKLKYETDADFRSRVIAIGKQQAKLNRKQRECIVCGRKFWRTPETRNRRTCSDQCRDAGRRKGLRVGWV